MGDGNDLKIEKKGNKKIETNISKTVQSNDAFLVTKNRMNPGKDNISEKNNKKVPIKDHKKKFREKVEKLENENAKAKEPAMTVEEERRKKWEEIEKKKIETIAHSDSLFGLIKEAEKQRNLKKTPEYTKKLVYVPEKSVLTGLYKASFTDRLGAKRVNSLKKKGSALDIKHQNANALKNAETEVEKERLTTLSFLITKDQMNAVDSENGDYNDLAQFMTQSEQDNKELISLYYGEKTDAETGENMGQDVQKALDIMLSQLFKINNSGLRLDNEAEIANNAQALETM